MTESIGGFPFIRIDGGIDPPGLQQTEITRPGVSGRAYRLDNYRGDEFELSGVVDTDDPVDLLSSYKGLVGTVVAIDHLGALYSNYLVRNVKEDTPFYCANPVGGINGGHWIHTSHWTLVYVGG